MEFSDSSIYSMVSTKGNEKSLAVIKCLIEVFKGIKRASDAKRILKEDFGIENIVQNFPLVEDGFMNTAENNNLLIINILCENINVTFSYLK